MCELLAISSKEKFFANEILKEFYSHSTEHPHGWGLAIFHQGIPSIEKEPIRADKSVYLKERLRHSIYVRQMIAHIRLATIGNMEYENCHPFVKGDKSGRRWTLAHNGTMFHCPIISPFFHEQEGETDSERVLFYLVSKINQALEKGELSDIDRFEIVEKVIKEIVPKNKLNLIINDGETMYIHTNYKNSLFIAEFKNCIAVSTRPLGKLHWKNLPMNTLCAYSQGALKFTGTPHNFEYIVNEEDLRFLYTDFAGL